MNTSNINTNEAADTLAQDFKTAVFIVSLVANLTVFVAWMALALV